MKYKNQLTALAKKGYSANKALKALKKKGYGYRRKDFLADYAKVKEAPRKKDAIKYVPKKFKPGLHLFTPAITAYDKDFQYKVRVDYVNAITGKHEEDFITMYGDGEIPTAEKLEAMALYTVDPDNPDTESGIIEAVHPKATVVEAMRKATPEERIEIDRKAKAKGRASYAKKKLKSQDKKIDYLEVQIAKLQEELKQRKMARASTITRTKKK